MVPKFTYIVKKILFIFIFCYNSNIFLKATYMLKLFLFQKRSCNYTTGWISDFGKKIDPEGFFGPNWGYLGGTLRVPWGYLGDTLEVPWGQICLGVPCGYLGGTMEVP